MLLHNGIIRYNKSIDIFESPDNNLNIVQLIELSFDFTFQMWDC